MSRFLNKPCVLLLWVIAFLSLKICLHLHHLHKNIWLDETQSNMCALKVWEIGVAQTFCSDNWCLLSASELAFQICTWSALMYWAVQQFIKINWRSFKTFVAGWIWFMGSLVDEPWCGHLLVLMCLSFIGLMCLVRFLLSVLISDRMRTCLVLPRQIKQLQFINLVLLLVSFSALIQLFYWTKVLIPLISILIWKNIWPFVWSSQDQSHKFCNINLYDHGLNEILNPWISMWSQSMDSDCISPIKGRKLESAYAYWIFLYKISTLIFYLFKLD